MFEHVTQLLQTLSDIDHLNGWRVRALRTWLESTSTMNMVGEYEHYEHGWRVRAL